jgi:copper chaperone
MTKSYRVLGMTCQGCASGLTKAIKELAPAAEVSVDLDAKLVSVAGPDDGLVKQAVEDAGFDFEGAV